MSKAKAHCDETTTVQYYFHKGLNCDLSTSVGSVQPFEGTNQFFGCTMATGYIG